MESFGLLHRLCKPTQSMLYYAPCDLVPFGYILHTFLACSSGIAMSDYVAGATNPTYGLAAWPFHAAWVSCIVP